MKSIFFLFSLLIALTAQAQIYSDGTLDKKQPGRTTISDFTSGDKLYTINFNAGLPVGSFGNFISGKLFNGLSFETRTFKSETFSLGLSIGFNSFHQKLPRDTYQIPNGAYSSVQTRYLYTVPVMIQGTHHFSVKSRWFKPYSGLGLGGHAINYDKWDGTYPDNKLSIRFGARAFAGTLIPLGETFGINVSARYNFALYQYNEINNLNYAEIAVGVYFIKF